MIAASHNRLKSFPSAANVVWAAAEIVALHSEAVSMLHHKLF